MTTFRTSRDINLGEWFTLEIRVDLTYTSYGAPAKTSGPPEYCDLGEPAEYDFDVYGDVVWSPTLLRDELRDLEDFAQEEAAADKADAEEAYNDYRYEQMRESYAYD